MSCHVMSVVTWRVIVPSFGNFLEDRNATENRCRQTKCMVEKVEIAKLRPATSFTQERTNKVDFTSSSLPVTLCYDTKQHKRVCRSVSLSVCRSVGRSFGLSVGRSVARSFGRWVVRSFGWSVSWSVGRSMSFQSWLSKCNAMTLYNWRERIYENYSHEGALVYNIRSEMVCRFQIYTLLCHARANLRVFDWIIRLRSLFAVRKFMSRLHWFSAARRRDI